MFDRKTRKNTTLINLWNPWAGKIYIILLQHYAQTPKWLKKRALLYDEFKGMILKVLYNINTVFVPWGDSVTMD